MYLSLYLSSQSYDIARQPIPSDARDIRMHRRLKYQWPKTQNFAQPLHSLLVTTAPSIAIAAWRARNCGIFHIAEECQEICELSLYFLESWTNQSGQELCHGGWHKSMDFVVISEQETRTEVVQHVSNGNDKALFARITLHWCSSGLLRQIEGAHNHTWTM